MAQFEQNSESDRVLVDKSKADICDPVQQVPPPDSVPKTGRPICQVQSYRPQQTSFYVAVPVTDNIDGYFISAAKWEELKLQLVRDENPENTNVDYDPETDDTDITENRYEN